LAQDTSGIFEGKLQKENKLDTLLKRFRKQEAPSKGTRTANRSRCAENVTAVDELLAAY